MWVFVICVGHDITIGIQYLCIAVSRLISDTIRHRQQDVFTCLYDKHYMYTKYGSLSSVLAMKSPIQYSICILLSLDSALAIYIVYDVTMLTDVYEYNVSKKSCPFLYSDVLHKHGQDFLNIQFDVSCCLYTNF